jgi:hypothetical protein
MLCVDGVLYMLVRNTGNSQVAWSEDYARTWRWSDWKFETSFGAPTFLNFGKNYAGARDDYVYVYSNDHDSAYEAGDRMVMARVPKDKSASRTPTNSSGTRRPRPTAVDQGHPRPRRRLRNPGRCYRSGISYNAGLKRYLWCQILRRARTARPALSGRLRHLRGPRTLGPLANGLLHRDLGHGPRRKQQPAHEMDERGRPNLPPALLRQRLFLRPQSHPALNCPNGRVKNQTSSVAANVNSSRTSRRHSSLVSPESFLYTTRL